MKFKMPMTKNVNDSQKEEISNYLSGLGFDLVKFSSLKIGKQHGERFKKWVEDGKHGEMLYLEKRVRERVTVEDILPSAKTLIVLATNYFQGALKDTLPNPLEPKGSLTSRDKGRVARYAVTRDYHKIIKKKLKQFDKYLLENFGAESKSYVDTGPILERAYAENTGLGYIGKNTCLITPEFGSWGFLSVVLTDLEISADKQRVKISCGDCRRCIDLCPTGAINEDKSIDARKCISYLTIENRGAIPVELREKVGNWLFGCDICQDVCPHNAKAKPVKSEDFKTVKIHNREIALEKILALKNDEEFLQLFAGTPLMRAKRSGLMRNACVVAGNSGNKNFIPLLKSITKSENAMLAEHAHFALKKLFHDTASM